MTIDGIQTIGLIGAGKIGGQVARAVIDAGYDAVISNSRGPETLADLVAELGPQARAATATEAAEAGDLVVVSVPVKAVPDVPVAPLAGKTVVDTNNYYPQRDGQIAELDEERTSTTRRSPRPSCCSASCRSRTSSRPSTTSSGTRSRSTPPRRARPTDGP